MRGGLERLLDRWQAVGVILPLSTVWVYFNCVEEELGVR